MKRIKRLYCIVLVLSVIVSYSLVISVQGLEYTSDRTLLTVSELNELGISYKISDFKSTETDNNGLHISSNVYTTNATPGSILDTDTLKTTDGTNITVYDLENWSSDEEAYQAHINDIIGGGYTGLTLMDYPTYAYNDIAYAWYDSTACWVDDMSISAFYNDIHAVEINETNVMEGDIVTYWEVAKDSNGNLVYYDCLHSAIVNEIKADGSIVCESKWDEYGLYIHNIENVHDDYKGSVVLNGVTVGACFYKYYRYTQDEHDLYMYQDNGEDGCIVKCNTSKNGETCTHTIMCYEAAEYDPSGESGHYISCPSGDFSFFAEHDNKYTKIENNLYYHDVRCLDCGYAFQEEHSWELISGVYRCSYCGITASYVPDIMSLSDEEIEAYIASLSDEELEEFIASLPEDQAARVTALLPSDDDELLTE